VVDEFTRESLADLVDHGIDADATVACLDKIAGARGRHLAFVRCDNGPELTANALRDWCRFAGTGASYIEPGSPWENPWVESYGSRMRDELLAIEQFDTLLEAQVLVADWRTDYNTYPPTLRSRHAHTGRLRGTLEDHQPTPALIAGGPINRLRSRHRRGPPAGHDDGDAARVRELEREVREFIRPMRSCCAGGVEFLSS
jgi:hypothetical protein